MVGAYRYFPWKGGAGGCILEVALFQDFTPT